MSGNGKNGNGKNGNGKNGNGNRMNPVKRALSWLAGPKSDFALFVIALVLLNLVGARAFLRIDLTENDAYSLSGASREIVRTLEQPLSVKVFFTERLPAPYNGVESYLRDILVEYDAAANANFSYEFFDMKKPENEDVARSYGISMVQIQEVKDDEVGFRNAWMGLALVHGDLIETVPELSSSDGLEYLLTTKIGRMVATANSLAGLSGKVSMTVYVSPELAQFNIAGFNQIEKKSFEAWNRVNKKNLDRIDYQKADPATVGVDELARRFGLQRISWADPASGERAGLIGIVLEHGDRFAVVPIELARTLFGGYAVAGLDSMEEGLENALRTLTSTSLAVGYSTGHGELPLDDERSGAGRFSKLASDTYEFREFNPDTEEIPAGLSAVVINGPTAAFSETALFRIDQFLMKGGSLMVMLDPFAEVQPDQQMAAYGAEPQFVPVDTGLGRLLDRYGVSVGKNYVLDKTCYEAQQRGMGKVPLYYVPVVGRAGLDQSSPVSRNLSGVIFLQAASVDAKRDSLPGGVVATTLASSSPESWLMSGRISLSPYGMVPPAADSMSAKGLAVLLEGTFASAFDAIPEGLDVQSGKASSAATGVETAERRLSSAVLPGKVFVVGTSKVTTPAVMDEQGRQPVAIFVRNALDYLNGRADLAAMRAKGLSLTPLDKTSPSARAVARAVNLYALPALVVAAGLVAWRLRGRRRKAIRRRYDPSDKRAEGGAK